MCHKTIVSGLEVSINMLRDLILSWWWFSHFSFLFSPFFVCCCCCRPHQMSRRLCLWQFVFDCTFFSSISFILSGSMYWFFSCFILLSLTAESLLLESWHCRKIFLEMWIELKFNFYLKVNSLHPHYETKDLLSKMTNWSLKIEN